VLLPVYTILFGLRFAVPGGHLDAVVQQRLAGLAQPSRSAVAPRRFVLLGAVPFAMIAGVLVTHGPACAVAACARGVLIGVVIWRRFQRQPCQPADPAFAVVGAATDVGSALLGSVGPLTAQFFLAVGLNLAAYIGTKAAAVLTMHLTKIVTYGVWELTGQVMLYGLALTTCHRARRLGRQEDRRPHQRPDFRPARRNRITRRGLCSS
jgi:hypothetical protein